VHASKSYDTVEVYVDSFLTLEQDEVEWSALRSACFKPVDVANGTYLIGGWVDSWTGIDTLEKTEIPYLYGNSEKKSLIFGPKSSRYTDCAIQTQTPRTSKLIITFNFFQVFRGLGCSHTEGVPKNAHLFLSRPGTCLTCNGPIFLKYWHFFFECCLSFLAQRVNCSFKLYLSVSPTNNILTDSYIESRMSQSAYYHPFAEYSCWDSH